MKKLLSLVLVLALLISLAVLMSCSDNDEQSAPDDVSPANSSPDGNESTEIFKVGDLKEVEVVTAADGSITYGGFTKEELEASLPNEHVPEKLAAGLEVHVAFSFNQMLEESTVLRGEGYKNAAAELGIEVTVSDAGDDIPTQIQQIENFITMDVALIQCIISTVDGFEDIAAEAIANGTYFAVTGQVPTYEISAYANVDHEVMGQQIAYTAMAWLDQQYPDAAEGSVKTAILGHTKVPPVALRTATFQETIDTDPRVDIVFYKDDCNSIDMAYTAAQEAYTVDPDIKLIMCFSAAQAVGANNYVVSIPEMNIEEYGIFCTVDDNATKDLVDMSAENDVNSAVRGILVTGTENSNIWDGEFRILKALLIQGVEETPFVSLDPFYCYNSVGYEFEFVQE